nr:glycine-rich protein 3 short isoform-like [Solanum lycopersicum]
MGLKLFILLTLALAVFITLTSEVAARELVESSTNTVEINKSEMENEVNEAKFPGDGFGGGYGGFMGGGYGGYPGRWYGGGGYCRFGCCRRNFYGDGGCIRCCYPGES